MRLRNIPRAEDTLQAHFTVIKNHSVETGLRSSETIIRYELKSEWEKDASY